MEKTDGDIYAIKKTAAKSEAKIDAVTETVVDLTPRVMFLETGVAKAVCTSQSNNNRASPSCTCVFGFRARWIVWFCLVGLLVIRHRTLRFDG
jgi:hypothetical protein